MKLLAWTTAYTGFFSGITSAVNEVCIDDTLEAPEELDIVFESVNAVVMERLHDEGVGILVGVNIG
jgi:hypothetical protein